MTRPLHHSQPVGVRIESAIIVKTVKIHLQYSTDTFSVSHHVRHRAHSHMKFKSVKLKHLHNDLTLSCSSPFRLFCVMGSRINIHHLIIRYLKIENHAGLVEKVSIFQDRVVNCRSSIHFGSENIDARELVISRVKWLLTYILIARFYHTLFLLIILSLFIIGERPVHFQA